MIASDFSTLLDKIETSFGTTLVNALETTSAKKTVATPTGMVMMIMNDDDDVYGDDVDDSSGDIRMILFTIFFYFLIVNVTAEVLRIENERQDHLSVYQTCSDEYKHELKSINNQRQSLLEQLQIIDNQVFKLNQAIIELDTKHENIMSTFNTRLIQLRSNNNTRSSSSAIDGSASNSNVLNSNIHIQNILHTIHTFEHQFADVLISQVIELSTNSDDVVMKINTQDPLSQKVTRNSVYLSMRVIIIIIIIITSFIIIIIIIYKSPPLSCHHHHTHHHP